MAQGERLALQSDLAWVGEYNGAITGDVSERMVAAIKEYQKNKGGKQTGVLNPQERARARRDGAAAAGECRLEDRDRCRHRRPARHSDQARAAAGQRRQRHQMDFADRHHPGAAGPAQGSGSDHGETRRPREEGARAHGRLHGGQAGLLRAVGPAGAEENLSARHLQGRRSPHHDHPVRSGGGEHGRAGRDRDVERVQCVPDRHAGARAAQARRIFDRHGRDRGRRHHCRP